MTLLIALLALPLVASIAIIALGSRAVRFSRLLALLGPGLALWVGASHVLEGLSGGDAPFMGLGIAEQIPWLPGVGDTFNMGFAVDSLSAVMLLVVGTVAFMVVVFSFGYMAGDDAQPRYFALLSLFCAAMSGLVVASSLVGLFVAWELVGACSYLLIGFWFRRPAAANAAMKAFLVTRVGDVGLLIALALLWRESGTLDIASVMAALPAMAAGTVTMVALLLFAGAAGKSAQFHLHIWLPDAMEGPTPVSALIHAATMVAAGVFLVARVWPVFEASPAARTVMLVVGTLTALGAATVAVTQTDIKRVLAYSTVSQLGFMFAALGAGAWVAAIFHLVTHAAFKSLLFLASGSVIHGSGTQDLREMGGLGRVMPVTAATWGIGVAALAGIPPLSGFFSKDGVLDAVWEHAPLAGAALFAASALTAFYAVRATVLAFSGTYRGDSHPHESPAVMTVPLVVLAALAATLGVASRWFGEAFDAHAGLSLPVAAASTAIALAFAFLSYRVFAKGPAADEVVVRATGPLWRAAAGAYGIDRAAMGLVRGVMKTVTVLAGSVERTVIDGAVRSIARLAGWVGKETTELQSGEGSLYAALVAVGACLMIALALWIGR